MIVCLLTQTWKDGGHSRAAHVDFVPLGSEWLESVVGGFKDKFTGSYRY